MFTSYCSVEQSAGYCEVGLLQLYVLLANKLWFLSNQLREVFGGAAYWTQCELFELCLSRCDICLIYRSKKNKSHYVYDGFLIQ